MTSSLIFFVSFWVNLLCISTFGSSSSLSNFFIMLFIHSDFSLCFLIAIFQSKIVRFLLHPVVDMLLCHLLPVVDWIFFCCLGMSCFASIVLPFVKISLIFFISPVPSGLFPKFVQLFFLCWLFLFVPTFSSVFILFYHLACFLRCFILVSSRISHPGLDFFFVFFKGSHFFHKFISPA